MSEVDRTFHVYYRLVYLAKIAIEDGSAGRLE